MNHELGERIGIGRTADVYAYHDDTILKLFKKECSGLSEQEVARHTLIQEYGLPVPKLHDVVTVNDRTGLIYKRVHGVSMLHMTRESMHKLPKYARDMAALHREVGSCQIEEGLPSMKDDLERSIGKQKLLDINETLEVVNYLNTLPEGDRLCHGDFHPDNILVEGDQYYIIDWETCSKACFSTDVMRTHLLMTYGSPPEASLIDRLVSRWGGKAFMHYYYKELYKDKSINKGERLVWEMPILSARLIEGVPESEKEKIVKRLRLCLKQKM